MGSVTKKLALCISLYLMLLCIFTACNDNNSEGQTREYPNLSSLLYRLIEANEQGKAEEFAQQRSSIMLDDGNVLVGIYPEEGKVEKALAAVRKHGGTVETKVSKSGSFGAYVPIDSLIPLIQERSILHIRTPEKPVH